MTVQPDLLSILDTIELDKGSHTSIDQGACVLELVSYVAGEPWSDHPACASPVLTNFCISLNDRWDTEQRQTLKPFIPRIVGTRDDGKDELRGYLALDWLIRTYTPAWLDLAGLTIEAQELRSLRRIVDMGAAQNAGPLVRASRDKAAAAGDAAGDAAGAAAWDAARNAAGAAAWAAARNAAGAAAGAAAWDAAGNAAWAAAWAAAGAALKPTVQTLQASTLDLLDRMIDGRWQ